MATSEASEDEDDDDHGERGVQGSDDVGDEPCYRRNGRSPATAKPEGHAVVYQGGSDIPKEGREEEQGDHRIVNPKAP